MHTKCLTILYDNLKLTNKQKKQKITLLSFLIKIILRTIQLFDKFVELNSLYYPIQNSLLFLF